MDKLTEMIYRMNIAMPIQVEIDQTGYIKSIETGMYMMDEDGYGFELTE